MLRFVAVPFGVTSGYPKDGTSSLERVTGIIEEARRNSILFFLHKKTEQILKLSELIQKVLFQEF
jgi:hypothetical protein